MSKKPNLQDQILKEAESQLGQKPLTLVQLYQGRELLHEPRLYEIELEMQNEQLRQAQLAMEESRDRYVDLYEFAPVGYLSLTRDGMIAKVNLTGASLLGVERKKLIQRRFAAFVTSEDSDHWHRLFLNVLQHNVHQSCELMLFNVDGSRFHARLDCLRMEADVDEPMVRIALTDITEGKLIEEQLRLTNESFQLMVDSVSDHAIFMMDIDGRVMNWNSGAERIKGYSAEEIIGRHFSCFYTPEDIDKGRPQQVLDVVIAKGRLEDEGWRVRKNGSSFWANMVLTAVRDQAGHLRGFTNLTHDFTEQNRVESLQKESEAKLRDLTAHLQTVREEEKASIAREIHDELGGTLTGLKMDAYWLAGKLETHQDIGPLKDCVKSMIGLLDTAVSATRRIITDLRPTILDDLGLQEALKWQAAQFHNRTGIECRVVCIGNEDCEDRSYKTISINLFRIFQETLTNVARHSGASKVEVEFLNGDEVILTISDNGCGLPEGHIVAPTSFGMLGMRERVEQLGGNIKFVSQPGCGLCVAIILPLPDALQAENNR